MSSSAQITEPPSTHRSDQLTRQLYSTDASIYQVQPEAVNFPHSVEDLRDLVLYAREHDQSITIRGGGTSLSGQAIGEGIVVDCSRHLDDVLELKPDERVVRVQPGVILSKLNRVLASKGLMFGPDVATENRATIGGMIGNNSAGAHSIQYGHTVEHLQGVTCLLSNGERVRFAPVSIEQARERAGGSTREARLYEEIPGLIRDHADLIRDRFPDLPRNVAGYSLDRFLDGLEAGIVDFARLIAGSEGTLALTETATLELVERPKQRVLGILHCDSMNQALEANQYLANQSPASIELIDQKIIELARNSLEYESKLHWVEGNPRALLVVETTGETQEEAVTRLRQLKAELKEQDYAGTFLEAIDPELQEDVWAVRKAGLPLLLGLPGNRKPTTFVEDTVVGTERLANYVEKFQELVESHGTEAAYYGHSSVGCLHIRPLIDLKDGEDIDSMRDLARDAVDLVADFEGTISGEHGDGMVRSEWLERYYGPEIVELFRRIKKLFDPETLLNPGKIVDPTPMNQNLRYGEQYQASVPETVQDLSEQEGLQGIVERCNGNAACRKEDSGAMCPSYMATRDEIHSTRGRANALRGLLDGDLSPESLTDGTLEEVMELCISCKACKSECPSNVDMAPLKEEIQHKINQKNGTGLREKLFGLVGPIARKLESFQPIASWVQRIPGIETLVKSALKISPERSLPRFDADPFRGTGTPHEEDSSGEQIVLYVDTFNGYIDSEIGRTAYDFLDRLGYEVVVPETPCCGRPMMSKGFLKRAKQQVGSNLDVLYKYAEQGIPIIGLEPSCVSVFTDDAPRYAPGKKANVVAEQVDLFSTFMNRTDKLEELRVTENDVLIHGHCHQEALWGGNDLKTVMESVTEGAVELIDAGCCGMAGSFGYEKEHYEHSEAMAKRRLVPEVVSAGADTVVIAEGTSCRQQINDFANRKALHPAQFLADKISGRTQE